MQAYLFVEVEWEAEPSAIKHLSCGTGYNLGEKHNCYIKDSTEKNLEQDRLILNHLFVMLLKIALSLSPYVLFFPFSYPSSLC